MDTLGFQKNRSGDAKTDIEYDDPSVLVEKPEVQTAPPTALIYAAVVRYENILVTGLFADDHQRFYVQPLPALRQSILKR